MTTACRVGGIHEAYEAGLSVIPIRPGQKFPAVAWKRFQSARASLEQIREWESLPAFGIVTGSISGIVVVDADDREARAWCLANLPGTPLSVETGLRPDGSRGLHLFYKWTERTPNRARVHGLRLDVRGDGGQVLGPGSIHPGSGVQYEASRPITLELLESLPAYPADQIGGGLS